MSYNIQYNPELRKKYPNKRKRNRNGKAVFRWVLFTTILITIFSLQRKGILKELLIPGESSVTVAAAENLSESLKAGMPVKDAVVEFCLDVMDRDYVY